MTDTTRPGWHGITTTFPAVHNGRDVTMVQTEWVLVIEPIVNDIDPAELTSTIPTTTAARRRRHTLGTCGCEEGSPCGMWDERCVTCWGDEDDDWMDSHDLRRDVPADTRRSCCGALQCDDCLARFTCAECGD